MAHTPPLFLSIVILAGISGIGLTILSRRSRNRTACSLALASALPGIGMILLFYSLAVHMRESLGSWPAAIGTRGFPDALNAHASAAGHYFSALLVTCMIAWPVACSLSFAIRRWRGALLPLGMFALSCAVSFGAMMLAPHEFLHWWWD